LVIIEPEIVETFFNLLWVAVIAALVAVWIATRPRRTESLRPAIGMQLGAFVVLALILLPVISLTDDLQARINPAETEHVARCGDQPSLNQRLHPMSVDLAQLAFSRKSPSATVWESVAAEERPSGRMHRLSRALATRPPPAATWPI
jgi:hypothetical protein